MRILAIETSCDETSAAVVKDGKEILSNIVATQVEFHKKYGGIVPEVASRKHIEVINPIIEEALNKAKVKPNKLDAIAVTYGPGLIGSLVIGLCAAKALAYSLKKPLIGVNHLEAHLYANFLFAKPKFPFICLLVSGGHTMIILVKDHGKYELIGQTRDDAAGEAFDKVARLLKLGYPGGPIIDQLAKQGNAKAVNFTRPMLDDGFDFSFSGIKTAVVNHVRQEQATSAADLAASFQQAVVDVLVKKTVKAAKANNCRTIALGGGVAANSLLRHDMAQAAKAEKVETLLPPLSLCTDNAAMVGACAYFQARTKRFSDLSLQAVASLKLV